MPPEIMKVSYGSNETYELIEKVKKSGGSHICYFHTTFFCLFPLPCLMGHSLGSTGPVSADD